MNGFSITTARSGEPTASYGSLRIHSAYDPDKEARRFLESRLVEIQSHSVIVVLGAALGYIERILREEKPECRIIAIHFESDLYNAAVTREIALPQLSRWHPQSGIEIETFLFDVLDETSISGLTVIEWPVSKQINPGQFDSAARALAAVIRRHSGNISATAAFGRIWIRNSLRNFLELENVVIPEPTDQPIVLAASGPNLEKSLDIIKSFRSRFRLWALPSALPALVDSDLEPDLIVASDPGYWAKLHSRYYPENVPVAMPLTAIPPPTWSGGTLLLAQSSPGEDFFLKDSAWPRLNVPSMGTVAATAVEIWKGISSGPLFIAGLDLCWDDLRSHARPHAFDSWLQSGTSRLNPLYNEIWGRAMKQAPKRMGRIRTGPTLQTYLDWFTGNTPKGRIFRLLPPGSEISSIPIPGIAGSGSELFEDLPGLQGKDRQFRIGPPPVEKKQREELIRKLIADWKVGIENSAEHPDIKTGELMYALDPGGVLDIKRSSGNRQIDAVERHRETAMGFVTELESIYG